MDGSCRMQIGLTIHFGGDQLNGHFSYAVQFVAVGFYQFENVQQKNEVGMLACRFDDAKVETAVNVGICENGEEKCNVL